MLLEKPTKFDNGKCSTDKWWLRSMDLSTTEHHSLISGGWLSDRIISAAQALLKQQFPHIDGFQCSLLGESLKFKPISQNKPFIQIIYTGINYYTELYTSYCSILSIGAHHWICVSCVPTFTPRSPKMCVFDSLTYYAQLTSSTVLQIANLINTPKSFFKLEKKPVQQQEGLNDCALFAVAFAIELCLHNIKDIETLCFDQKQMRDHLCECLENRKMFPFPKLSSNDHVVRSSPSVLKISVYCLCRLPDIYDDDNDKM